MAEQRDNALLLRAIPYSDSSLIIHCLTASHGRISLMARGARRTKSPFRASLMPLYKLQIRWKEPRTGSMGTLLEAQRLQPLLPESHMLTGQELLSKASSLFPDGVHHGYEELLSAFHILSERSEASGFPAAVWHMLESSGWVADFEHCWHCSESISLNEVMYWYKANLLCAICANKNGSLVSAGCRKSIIADIAQTNIKLQTNDIKMWNVMTQDVMRKHQPKSMNR